MANEMTIDYSKFDPTHLTFTKVEENSRSKGQLIAYPRYDPTNTGKEGVLILQSPWIKLFTYGVPRLGEYYKTEADRSHLRVPFDMTIPEVAMFAQKMKDLDNQYSTPEMMESMLGKKSKKYKYQCIFREGQDQTSNESDDDDEPISKDMTTKNAPPRPPYMKIKLDMTWPDNDVKTQVFNSVLDQTTNKRIRTKIDNIKTIDDFANAVRFLSNVRLMFRPVKFWAHQLTKKDPQCGIVFKLLKVEVEPNKASNSMYKQIYECDNFIDDDDDDSLPIMLNKVTLQENIVSDDESSDEEIITKKPTTIVEVDSDSSDDDDNNDNDNNDDNSDGEDSEEKEEVIEKETSKKQVTLKKKQPSTLSSKSKK
jgi:hypothetical protein